MLNFLARRIVQLIPTLFFVSILIFSLQHLLPGDPALVMAGEERDPDVIAQIASVQEALRGLGRQLLRHHLKHCATSAIKKGPAEADRTYDELLELITSISR